MCLRATKPVSSPVARRVHDLPFLRLCQDLRVGDRLGAQAPHQPTPTQATPRDATARCKAAAVDCAHALGHAGQRDELILGREEGAWSALARESAATTTLVPLPARAGLPAPVQLVREARRSLVRLSVRSRSLLKSALVTHSGGRKGRAQLLLGCRQRCGTPSRWCRPRARDARGQEAPLAGPAVLG
jgi:hypothetical protein